MDDGCCGRAGVRTCELRAASWGAGGARRAALEAGRSFCACVWALQAGNAEAELTFHPYLNFITRPQAHMAEAGVWCLVSADLHLAFLAAFVTETPRPFGPSKALESLLCSSRIALRSLLPSLVVSNAFACQFCVALASCFTVGCASPTIHGSCLFRRHSMVGRPSTYTVKESSLIEKQMSRYEYASGFDESLMFLFHGKKRLPPPVDRCVGRHEKRANGSKEHDQTNTSYIQVIFEV